MFMRVRRGAAVLESTSQIMAAHTKVLKATLPPIAPRPTERIRILLADDHQIVREGIRALLALQPDFLVIGEAADGDEALRLAIELRPDVLLLDFSMPKKTGLEVLRELQCGPARIRTILL